MRLKRKPLYTGSGNINRQLLWKTVCKLLKNLKTELLFLLVDIDPKENEITVLQKHLPYHAHCSFILSHDTDTT